MRLTCGTTAAEEKGKLARVVKVLIQHLLNLFFAINLYHYFLQCTNCSFVSLMIQPLFELDLFDSMQSI
jgi:hypothetical protein